MSTPRDRHAGAAVARPGGHRRGRGTPVERASIRGARRVQEVAHGEDTGLRWCGSCRRPPARSLARFMATPSRRGSSFSAIQSPVNTTVSHSMTLRVAGGVVGDLDRGHAVAAEDVRHARAGEQGEAVADAGPEVERRVRGVRGLVGDHRDGAAAGVREGHHRGVRDVLGADDDGAGARLLPGEGDGPLQPARGEHAGGPGAGDEAGGARPLAAAGREDQGPGGRASRVRPGTSRRRERRRRRASRP